MKIGFLGNANNYPFMLARALRRAGHDVLFVLSRLSPLDRPENRYADVDVAASPWILDAGSLEATERFQFLPESPLREQVIGRLRECDAVILNHGALSLASAIGRPHIAMLTGTDIQDLASPEYVHQADDFEVRERLWLPNAIARQRSGIASAVAVSVFCRGLVPRHDAALDGLGVGSNRRFFCWMTDPLYLKESPPPHNRRVRIFNLARLTWKRVGAGEFTEDHKASDVMILGLAKFSQRHPEVDFEVRLVRKGLQVGEVERLVEATGLQSRVTWLAEMKQNEVFEECRRADIVLDQLGLSIVGMGGLDAMALGRPLIANARPDVMRHYLPETPVCQAATADEVAGQLERLVLQREERERVGHASRSYVEEHCSADAAAAIFAERLEAVVSNPKEYSLWSERMLEARENLVIDRENRLAEADARLAERGTVLAGKRLADVERRENAVLLRESFLAQREENAARIVQERAELARSWAAYDALRIVRWQRALKSWRARLTGKSEGA